MKQLKKKRPVMAAQQWFFYRDNVPVHSAAVIQRLIAAAASQLLHHPPNSPDLARMCFFLFRRAKEELAGISLGGDSIKTAQEGVTRAVAAEEATAVLQR